MRGRASPDNFDTLTPDAIRGFIDQLLSLVAAIVVPVTCISLVVVGIVIMNIMLVSVTERTREIGVRKSLGVRHGDVMMQILIEAVVLAAMGGALGVALGAAVTVLLSKVFEITMHISAAYVILAIGVSDADCGSCFRMVSGFASGTAGSGGRPPLGVSLQIEIVRRETRDVVSGLAFQVFAEHFHGFHRLLKCEGRSVVGSVYADYKTTKLQQALVGSAELCP